MKKFQLASLAFAVLATPVGAGELVVRVTGISSAGGEVGCALHDSAAVFPAGQADTPSSWQQADPAGVTCRFPDLTPGLYAVAVSQDMNGNRKTDTNFLGMPKEDWGVSNNIRPNLRAPTFEEAQLAVGVGGVTEIQIRIAR